MYVPRIAKGEKQCKRARKQHKTTQRKEHPGTQPGNSASPKKNQHLQQKHLKANNFERTRIWGSLIFSLKPSYLDLEDNWGSTVNIVSHKGLKERSKVSSDIEV